MIKLRLVCSDLGFSVSQVFELNEDGVLVPVGFIVQGPDGEVLLECLTLGEARKFLSEELSRRCEELFKRMMVWERTQQEMQRRAYAEQQQEEERGRSRSSVTPGRGRF